jgi:hypothetical protein
MVRSNGLIGVAVLACTILALFATTVFVVPTSVDSSRGRLSELKEGYGSDVHIDGLYAQQSHTQSQLATLSACGLTLFGACAAVSQLSKSKKASKVVRMAWDKETALGAQAPLGFWDPVGFCENEEKFKDLRAKELKHGRLAMMGAVGMLVQSIVQVPGMDGVPKSVAAITVGNGMVGGIAIFAIIGVLEAAVFVQDPNKEPGDFGNPLPWFDDYSTEMRAKELNNGRMAMGSALVIVANSLLSGKDALQLLGQ